MVSRLSYLYNGNPIPVKTVFIRRRGPENTTSKSYVMYYWNSCKWYVAWWPRFCHKDGGHIGYYSNIFGVEMAVTGFLHHVAVHWEAAAWQLLASACNTKPLNIFHWYFCVACAKPTLGLHILFVLVARQLCFNKYFCILVHFKNGYSQPVSGCHRATRGNLTHWGRDKMAAILQTTFSNACS